MGRKKVGEDTPVVVQPPTVRIIGCGGEGFWMAVGLARSGVRPIAIYDTDTLEGGLGHMRLPNAVPATRKVDLLRGFLAVNFRGAGFNELSFHAERFTGREAVAGDLVIDCSDMSGDDRRAIYQAVKKRKARYLRVSYDGAASVVAVAEGLPLTGDESHAGYSAVPSLALSLVAGGIGAEVVAKTDWSTAEFIEFQISLAECAGFPVVGAELVEEAA